MEQLKPTLPAGIEYSIPYDSTMFVRDAGRQIETVVGLGYRFID